QRCSKGYGATYRINAQNLGILEIQLICRVLTASEHIEGCDQNIATGRKQRGIPDYCQGNYSITRVCADHSRRRTGSRATYSNAAKKPRESPGKGRESSTCTLNNERGVSRGQPKSYRLCNVVDMGRHCENYVIVRQHKRVERGNRG